MSESSLTLGSLILTLVFTLFIMSVLSPIVTVLGVYNPTLNSTTPQGQYLNSVFGSNGIAPFINTSLNVNFLPSAQNSANLSTGALAPSSLAVTSGFAFIAGGFSLLATSLYNFPKFIWVMLTETFSYGGLSALIPIDIAGLLSAVILTYVIILIIFKVTSIISKPGNSIENI